MSDEKRQTSLTREEAWKLLTQYNQDPFHLQHAETVEKTMRYFAGELGYQDEADYWGIVGLLHDLDFEQFPEEHCIKSQEIMRKAGIDESIIRATACHGYGITVDIKPEHEMEKVLYATDELTGLLGAVILMYPSKSSKHRNLPPDVPEKLYKTERTCSAGLSTNCWREPFRQYSPLNHEIPC